MNARTGTEIPEMPKEHYVSMELSSVLKKHIDDHIHPRMRTVLESYKYCICGGAMRSFYSTLAGDPEVVRDLDVYVDLNTMVALYQYLLTVGDEEFIAAVEISEGGRIVTVKFGSGFPEMQIIAIHGNDLQSILKEFDYTVNKVGTDGKIVMFHENFINDLAAKELIYTGDLFPLGSLRNAFKYVSRGYHLSNEQLGILLADACRKDLLKHPEDIYHSITQLGIYGEEQLAEGADYKPNITVLSIREIVQKVQGLEKQVEDLESALGDIRGGRSYGEWEKDILLDERYSVKVMYECLLEIRAKLIELLNMEVPYYEDEY